MAMQLENVFVLGQDVISFQLAWLPEQRGPENGSAPLGF